MKALLAGLAAVCVAVAVWLVLGQGHAADSGKVGQPLAAPSEAVGRLVVHEWGTFTSFSGSDGVPVGFHPNNTDLPNFVYAPEGSRYAKGERLSKDGTVSMETPVIYFYTDHETQASVRVDFPKGWLTEWYPFAAAAPVQNARQPAVPGQSIRWDVRLLPGQSARFPKDERASPYYHARQTDSVPLQAEVLGRDNDHDPALQGGAVVQREKFLFYRGVGTFPTPVTVRAMGNGNVRISSSSGYQVEGLILVRVKDGRCAFKAIGSLAAGGQVETILPEVDSASASLGELMVKELTTAGLYEKEAKAMVKTWEAAWFGEEGARLFYLVPRTRTDELLPLTIEPKPTEVVRVLVGRHDFVTPEQEAWAAHQVQRLQAAQSEMEGAEKDLLKIGRFAAQVRQMAEKRLMP